MRNIYTLVLSIGLGLWLLSGCTVKNEVIWNGVDFSGWQLFVPDDSVDVSTVWTVEDSVIHCTGVPNGYMQTEKEFENYELELEWRWPAEAGNSGVLLHSQEPDAVWPECIECQLKSGRAGDFVLIKSKSITVDGEQYVNEKMFLVIPHKEDGIEKPLGEWNHYKIICDGDAIGCWVNGVLQNSGIRASLSKGKISLQSEGAPVEFRNISLTSLK